MSSFKIDVGIVFGLSTNICFTNDNGDALMLMPGGGFVFTIYCLTHILVVSDKRILSLISIAYLNESTFYPLKIR